MNMRNYPTLHFDTKYDIFFQKKRRVQHMCDARSLIHRYNNAIVPKSGFICHRKYSRSCVLYMVATCIKINSLIFLPAS